MTVTSLNGVARTLAIVVELFVGLLAMIARARGITWLLRLLYGCSRRSNSQNIELILELKGYKTSFFSNQLVYSSIKRGRRNAIKKLTSDGFKVLVKWHKEFIETKFISNGSILLSILWGQFGPKLSEADHSSHWWIALVLAWVDVIQPLIDISWICE